MMMIQGCGFFGPDVAPVTVRAFRCAQPGQDQCTTPGAQIPVGSLPPLDEAFMVVANYRGSSSRWTLIYPSINAPGYMDSSVVEITAKDSAAVWVNLRGAKDGFYIERVLSSESVPDSIMWEYGWRRDPLASKANVQMVGIQ
jgi:hypothetical protein